MSLQVVILLITFSNCACPDDVVIAELSLGNKGVWPLQGSEEFTFVNENGDELVFKGSSKNAMQILPAIVMERMCSKAYLDYQDAIYKSEVLTYEYHLNTSVFLSYNYMVRNDIESPSNHFDTALYETLDLAFVNAARTVDPKTYNSFSLLVSDRGNSLRAETIEAYDNAKIIPDTTLNGTSYSDLWCPKIRPGIFYSTTYGIVLFNYNDHWWQLKR